MHALDAILFPEPDSPHSRLTLVVRAVLAACAVAASIEYFTKMPRLLGLNPQAPHYVSIVFHEAGHVIFGLFNNDLLTSLGGSLLQCLLPLVLAVAFYVRNRDAFSAGLGLWWCGQNLGDCAPYINDARMLALPLLGGGTGAEVEGHDWEFILTRLGLLDLDVRIAYGTLIAARIVMATGLLWAALALVREWRRSIPGPSYQ